MQDNTEIYIRSAHIITILPAVAVLITRCYLNGPYGAI